MRPEMRKSLKQSASDGKKKKIKSLYKFIDFNRTFLYNRNHLEPIEDRMQLIAEPIKTMVPIKCLFIEAHSIGSKQSINPLLLTSGFLAVVPA